MNVHLSKVLMRQDFFFSANLTVRIGLALCWHRIPDSLKVRPGTHQSPRQGRFSLGLCCTQTSVLMQNKRMQVYSTDTHISNFRSVCGTIVDECPSI